MRTPQELAIRLGFYNLVKSHFPKLNLKEVEVLIVGYEYFIHKEIGLCYAVSQGFRLKDYHIDFILRRREHFIYGELLGQAYENETNKTNFFGETK